MANDIPDMPIYWDGLDTYRSDVPLVIVGLLQYENKMTVVNFAIKRHTSSEELIVKNKEHLVFVTPLRR